MQFQEAKEIAMEDNSDFGKYFDTWYETEKAFVFADSSYEGVGGFRMPFFVMKDNGEVRYDYSQAMMMGKLGENIAEGMI